jgi:hypothetical protein
MIKERENYLIIKTKQKKIMRRIHSNLRTK